MYLKAPVNSARSRSSVALFLCMPWKPMKHLESKHISCGLLLQRCTGIDAQVTNLNLHIKWGGKVARKMELGLFRHVKRINKAYLHSRSGVTEQPRLNCMKCQSSDFHFIHLSSLTFFQSVYLFVNPPFLKNKKINKCISTLINIHV